MLTHRVWIEEPTLEAVYLRRLYLNNSETNYYLIHIWYYG